MSLLNIIRMQIPSFEMKKCIGTSSIEIEICSNG